MSRAHGFIWVLCLTVSVFYSGCASYNKQHIHDTEQRLLSAGFLAHGPDFAGRRDLLDTLPAHQVVNRQIGGTNWFGYVYPQLSNTNSGLSYFLELTTNLVSGIWTNSGYSVLGTNVTGGDLNFVTNITDTVDDQKFIRLIIE